jgi:hypothetical protein
MSELIDTRAGRIRTLKTVIQGLHEGEPIEAVRRRLRALVRACDASEIAAMEQELIAEGMPVSQVMGMCDLHSKAVRDVLVEDPSADVAPGHPVDTFRRENAALRQQVERLRTALASLGEGAEDAPADPTRLEEALRCFGLLMDLDKHYQRKEHLLFPFLERHGITGPSTVMWGKDDEVRALLEELGAALSSLDGSAGEWRLVASTVAEAAFAALLEMMFKEEHILFPVSLQKLTDTEWREIAAQEPQFGYCLVDPLEGWPPRPDAASAESADGSRSAGYAATESTRSTATGAVVLPSGALSLSQLKAVFATLPVDLTFVDADDRVRFFSEGLNRVFNRAKAVIGRRVQHCHPPASVGMVDRILSDFRSGGQNVAEFWIERRGRFIHIRYFAVRDEAGAYQGTLEVTQDLTRERRLEGERRLLQYEADIAT